MVFGRIVLTVALCGCVAGGCSSDATRKDGASRSTTSATAAWTPPEPGDFVSASAVPAPTPYGAHALWTAAAETCREYDAAHGTATRITVDRRGQLRSDSDCLASEGFAAQAR